jgi:hypothetical protein
MFEIANSVLQGLSSPFRSGPDLQIWSKFAAICRGSQEQLSLSFISCGSPEGVVKEFSTLCCNPNHPERPDPMLTPAPKNRESDVWKTGESTAWQLPKSGAKCGSDDENDGAADYVEELEHWLVSRSNTVPRTAGAK